MLALLGGLVLSVGVAVTGWLAGNGGSLAGAVRAGAAGWLMAHGSGLQTPHATLTIVPVGWSLVVAAVVWSASAWVARTAVLDGSRSVVVVTATMAACYAAMATLIAVLVTTDDVAVSPPRALAGSLLLVAVVAGPCLAARTGVAEASAAGWSPALRAVLRGSAAVVACLVAAGALLVTVSLLADFGQAATVASALDSGVAGGAVLTALQVLLLPNAALLGVSYLVGPGFVIGTDTLVTPAGASLGQVPALPMLAALPPDGAAPSWAMALLGAPAGAGAIGALVALRAAPAGTLGSGLLRGGAAGLLGGAGAGLLTALGGGSVGPGRMSEVGALVWECAGAGAGAAAIGAALASGVHVWWRRRRL